LKIFAANGNQHIKTILGVKFIRPLHREVCRGEHSSKEDCDEERRGHGEIVTRNKGDMVNVQKKVSRHGRCWSPPGADLQGGPEIGRKNSLGLIFLSPPTAVERPNRQGRCPPPGRAPEQVVPVSRAPPALPTPCSAPPGSRVGHLARRLGALPAPCRAAAVLPPTASVRPAPATPPPVPRCRVAGHPTLRPPPSLLGASLPPCSAPSCSSARHLGPTPCSARRCQSAPSLLQTPVLCAGYCLAS
jgi:hypothetical protein